MRRLCLYLLVIKPVTCHDRLNCFLIKLPASLRDRLLFRCNHRWLSSREKMLLLSKTKLLALTLSYTLRKACPYLELFWSAFSRIRTEYGEKLRISLYSVQMRENMDQNNSECGQFLRSDNVNDNSITFPYYS